MDLDAAREIFETSQDLTVGIEEEWGLVDPETLELVPKFEAMRDEGLQDDVLKDAISGELISSEIEIRSGRGEDLQHALKLQREARRRLFALADKHGVTLASTGTHPLSDYRQQHIIDTEHYRRVQDGLQYVARRNNTFALQVHVGIRGGDRAIKVCDRLRPVLPTLLAISANSPYIDGRDSGSALGPHADVHEVVPALRHPGRLRKLAELAGLRAAAAGHQLDRRVHPALVVRPRAPLVRDDRGAHLRRPDDRRRGRWPGRADRRLRRRRRCARSTRARRRRDLPGRLIEENMWRALRYGQDGLLLDLEGPKIEEYPAAEAIDRLRAWTGADIVLPELNGAQRQRRMIDAGHTPYEVFKQCVEETRATYPAQEKVEK